MPPCLKASNAPPPYFLPSFFPSLTPKHALPASSLLPWCRCHRVRRRCHRHSSFRSFSAVAAAAAAATSRSVRPPARLRLPFASEGRKWKHCAYPALQWAAAAAALSVTRARRRDGLRCAVVGGGDRPTDRPALASALLADTPTCAEKEKSVG